uniref:Interleukin-31 n=1 Tax=Bos mutus grunniens TaxID=30521 RepID=A0A8B9WPN1_BOSMU
MVSLSGITGSCGHGCWGARSGLPRRRRRLEGPNPAQLRWRKLGRVGVCGPCTSQHHCLFPGSSGLALFLLCCSGALLSSHSHPLPQDVQSAVITELKFSFSKLMEEYEQKEKGVAESCTCRMQCFSVSPQPPHNINSSAILPYFRAIKPFFKDTNNFSDVMDHLKKLELQRAPDIAVPTATYPSKMFVKCVLETFSKCLKLVGTEPPKVTEDHLVDPVPFDWQECKEP